MPPLIAVFASGRIGAASGNMITAPTPTAKPVTQLPLYVVEQRHLISPVIGTDHSPSRGPTKKERRAVKPDAKETAWLIREEWAKPSSFIGTHRKRHPRHHLNSPRRALQELPKGYRDRLFGRRGATHAGPGGTGHEANIHRPW